jgi:hypothetical protein
MGRLTCRLSSGGVDAEEEDVVVALGGVFPTPPSVPLPSSRNSFPPLLSPLNKPAYIHKRSKARSLLSPNIPIPLIFTRILPGDIPAVYPSEWREMDLM